MVKVSSKKKCFSVITRTLTLTLSLSCLTFSSTLWATAQNTTQSTTPITNKTTNNQTTNQTISSTTKQTHNTSTKSSCATSVCVPNPFNKCQGIPNAPAIILPVSEGCKASKQLNINLIESYEIALYSDPILQAAQAHYKAQKEVVPQALALFLPQINAQGIITMTHAQGESPPFNQFTTESYNINLAQPLVHLELFSQLSQAQQLKQQALATVLAAQQDLIIRTAERYFGVLAANDTLFFSTSQREAFFKQWEQARNRFEVGLIAITDVLEAKAGYDNAVAQEIAAQNQLRDRYEQLRELLGCPIHSVKGINQDRTFPLLPPSPQDQEKWVYTANMYNLELQGDQAAANAAKANIKTQIAGHLPTLDLTVQAGYVKPPPTAPSKELFPTQVVTLSANLPLFEGGSVLSRTRQARAQYEEALKNLESRRRTVDSNVRQQYRGILTDISEIKALAESVISNKSALESIRAGYAAGTRTLVDILNAETKLLSVQRDYALARYAYLQGGLQLKRSAGTLKCEDLVAVSLLLTDSIPPAS